MSGTAPTIAIASVKVGPRFRRDVGDLDSLMASIQAVGLLHPVVIAGDGNLVAGARRLEACKRLKWSEVPVTILKVSDPVCRLAEADENEVRLSLCPTEQVAVKRFYAEQDRQEAASRKEETQGRPSRRNGSKTGADSAPVKAKSRDKTAKRANSGRTRLRQAEEVVAAAEADPKTYDPISAKMDATGNVNAAHKEMKKRQRAAAKATIPDDLPALTDRYRLYVGDIIEAGAQVASDSLDWIITDPPYPKDYLALYGDLAAFATRTLKPGGSLLAMVGQSYLPEIMAALGAGLRYHWTLAYLTPGGQSVQLWERKVNTFWKPVLWFVKGDYKGDWIGDVCRSDPNDNDKRFHEWGQSESGMADIIHRFTYPGQTICDPFLGGGTTAVVAVKMGRLFIGIDNDASAVETTTRRLTELVR
jgi:site-specific DNA-methyltransferase (adenine-specific)